MVSVVGWDIGGANIKLAYLSTYNNMIEDVKVVIKYFPIWKRGKEKLGDALKSILSEHEIDDVDLMVTTMTAELSDVYFSKREGVNHIITTMEDTFPDIQIKFLDVDGNLVRPAEAKRDPLRIAAANWYATGWIASKLSDDCLVVDVGSTTTSIIPVINGKVAAKGKNDLEKLIIGELVYTGALRTNIAAITQYVPYKESTVQVSSEYFAQSGDVHLLLGNISKDDYTADTPDGRGVSIDEAAARIARVICADLDLLSMEDILKIAKYVYGCQINQIVNGLNKLIENFNLNLKSYPAYTTGLGGDFLAKPALQKAGFKDIRRLSDYIGELPARATPAYALALMGVESIVGEVENWRLF